MFIKHSEVGNNYIHQKINSMFWFVFIGLLVLGYLFKFFIDLNKDNEDLKEKSLEEKFGIIVNLLNQNVFNGQGETINVDKKEFNLGKRGSNSLVKFHYSTGHLTIIYKTLYLEKEFEFQKQYSDVRNISVLDQQRIGKEILDGVSEVIESHLNKYIPLLEEKGVYTNGVKKVESNEVINNPLTDTWWNNQTDTTKNTLLWNIFFVPLTYKNNNYKDTGHQRFDDFDSWDKVLETNDTIRYSKPDYDINTLLDKIWRLERIFIDKLNQPVSGLEFLKVLTNIKSLNIRYNCYDITPLSDLINLEELHLWYNKVDIKSINTLKNLKELTLYNCDKEILLDGNLFNLKKLNILESRMYLDHIPEFKNLKKLECNHYVDKRNRRGSVESTHKTDLTSLSRFNHLEELHINNTYSKDENVLNYISRLKGLKKLHISGILLSLNPIKNLINIEYLKIHCYYRVDDPKIDLEPLRVLKKLKYLDIEDNQSNLDPLSSLKNLKELNLVGNRMNLNPISGLVNLEKLNLNFNNGHEGSEIIDFRPLSNLVNLTVLYLNHNQITSLNLLSILKNLINIEKLDLSSNKINTLIPLSRLKNLKKLNVDYNQLKDLIPLSQLTNLQELNIKEFDFCFLINDLSPISELPNLKKLILNNPKLDITSISKRKDLDIVIMKKVDYDI
jgi:internalin A